MSSSSTQIPQKRAKHNGDAGDGNKRKKSKRNGQLKDGKEKKDKGKSKATESEFQLMEATLTLSIAPVFANNPILGVEEMLDSMVMRYIPAFRGVVLAHSNARFLSKNGRIKGDCPFLICDVAFDATVWNPQIGMKIMGKIILSSRDHISLLVHQTFNVSIPRHHIPTEEWEFEHGPAENDPEYGPEAMVGGDEEVSPLESGGKWIHRLTAGKLGGSEGMLEFTVIGLTVANEMLSLVGSLQTNPFAEQHLPKNVSNDVFEFDSDDRSTRRALAGDIGDHLMNDDSSDLDTFEALGRMGDEVEAAREEEKRKEQAASEKKEKKRKRKSEAQVDGTADKPAKSRRKKA